MKRKNILRGLSAACGSLLAVTVTASTLMFNNEGMINQMLNLTTSEIVHSDETSDEDLDYYSQVYDIYGSDITNKSAALKLEMDVAAENVEQAEEGTVLLRNENQALPLSEGARLTIFGNGSYNSRLHKRLTESYVDTIETMTFNTAMEDTFGEDNVNTVLADNVYSSLGQTTNSEVIEADIGSVTAYEDTWADDYNDAAVVVLTRWGEEDGETVMTWTDTDGETKNYLGLCKNEEDLLSYLQEQKAAGVFDSIIVVINSDQMMELDWLEEYDIDSCLLAGIPGVMGLKGVANIIAGNVNPSGRTVDTYAANSLSAPATVYAADNTQSWTNVDEVNSTCEDAQVNPQHVDYYTIYAEGIYVGYKYYETRYEDSVLGQGGASSAPGATESDTWNYGDEVVYTFGYGLSYTTFDQELQSVEYDEENDLYLATVNVTNTGDTAGKSVVEVYAQTPYGDYEKENGIEKSSVMIIGFEKTDDLEPGESTTVTVEVDRYMLASYDANLQKGYILSSGDYYLAVGDNAHDALNNILAAKGMTTADGMDYDGNADKVYRWNQEEIDTESYRYSQVDEEVEVTNLFDDQQLESYGIDFTWLSRSDWEGTYPTEAIQIEATDEMMAELDTIDYTADGDGTSTSEYTQGADKVMMFITLKDLDWDDELWDTFIDQMTVEEMLALVADDTGAQAIEDIALPAQPRGDDGCGIYQGTLKATGKNGIGWVSDVVTARTWNKDRFESRGFYLGAEAIFSGINELWYGGGNIHRTPFGGRTMQYYSEDGNFSYIVGKYEAAAMQEIGVNYGIKHLVCNDSEYMRESLATFVNEQTIREQYLRAFEGAVTEGGALSIMTGFNRIGCTYVGVNEALLTGVVKTEWGYKGHITTDAGGGTGSGYKGHGVEQLMAGIDYTCWSQDTSLIQEAIDSGDGDVLGALREATKRNLYAASRTFIVNGLSSDTIVVQHTPWWKTALAAAAGVLALATIACAAGYIVLDLSGKKKKGGMGYEK